MWAGDHDLWHPNFVSTCIETLEEDPQIVLAYPVTSVIDVKGNVTGIMDDKIDTRGLEPSDRFKKIAFELVYCNMFYGLFRSSALRKITFPRRAAIGMDNLVLAEISLLGTIAKIERPLFYRRANLSGESPQSARKRRIEVWRRAGYVYEAELPFTLLAYSHLEIIDDSKLDRDKRSALANDVKQRFNAFYRDIMKNEKYNFEKVIKNVTVDELSSDRRQGLLRAVKAIETFAHENRSDLNAVAEEVHSMSAPVISIVIPTYNRACYISEAIESVIKQNCQHVEILIIDDGSEDDTCEKVKTFPAERVRYICKEHSGAAASRNRGIRESRGEFILWLDSDDVLFPQTLSMYLKLIKEYPDVDVFYGNLLVTDEKLRVWGKIKYEDWYGRNPELLSRMFFVNSIPNGGSIVRKKCFERIGMFDETFKRAHDYEFWTRLAPVAKFKKAEGWVLKWRWHSGNMSSGSVNIDQSYDIKVVKSMLERYTLRELFPKINFDQMLPKTAEGLAYWNAAQRFIALKDFESALEYLQFSYQRYPSGPNTLEMIERLRKQVKKNKRNGATLLNSNSSQTDITLKSITGNSKEQGRIEHGASSPVVTVIIPTHNRPDFLVSTLRSVLDQTFQNFEIIVVNDSGMDVGDIVQWLNRGNKISYVRHPYNQGLAAARNTGIKLARGKYLAYIDDDDLYYSDHLETLVNFLENNEYKAAYTDAYRAHKIMESGLYRITKKDVPYSYDFDYQRILSTNFIPSLCVMHEKQCLDTVGYFDENLNRHEDWDLWLRLSLKFRIAHIKKITCEFSWRKDGTSMSSGSKAEFRKTYEKVCDKHYNICKDIPGVMKEQKKMRSMHYYAEAVDLAEQKLVLKAMEAVKKSLDIDCQNKHALNLFQKLCTVVNRLEKETYHRDMGKDDREAVKYEQLIEQGKQYLLEGNLKLSSDCFRKVVEKDPSNLESIVYLGEISLKADMHQSASFFFEKAAELNPLDLNLRKKLSQSRKMFESASQNALAQF